MCLGPSKKINITRLFIYRFALYLLLGRESMFFGILCILIIFFYLFQNASRTQYKSRKCFVNQAAWEKVLLTSTKPVSNILDTWIMPFKWFIVMNIEVKRFYCNITRMSYMSLQSIIIVISKNERSIFFYFHVSQYIFSLSSLNQLSDEQDVTQCGNLTVPLP